MTVTPSTPWQRRTLLGAFALSVASASAGAFAQDFTTVRIGWGAFPDVPQFAVAADRNLWAAQRLDATIVPFASGRAGFEAMIAGQVDYAVMAEFPAVSGVMRGLKFSIVAVLSQYKAFRVITKGDKAMDLKSLAGKKIAVPVGTNVHFVIADAMQSAGVKAEFINVPPPEMAAALARGDVNAIMTFPNGYASARRALGAQYQEIRLSEQASSFVLAASQKAAANPALTRRVLATLLRGEEFITSFPAQAQEATAAFVGPGTTVDAVRDSWPAYEYRIKLDTATLDLMVRQGQWLKYNGLVRDGEPTRALYRTAFAPEALRSMDARRVTLQD